MNNERSLAKEITEGFEALKSMRNNEPVAWMCPTGLEYKQRATDFMYNDALYDTKLNWIPLYTHPAKKLTNREIDNLIADVAEKPTDEDLYDFAMAILRKAQEK